jgi:ABC-type branched-subunit amino acid transport system ATPase component
LTEAPADKPRKPALKLVGIRKNYGAVAAVAGVDLVVDEGEFFTLLGPSGSGKTVATPDRRLSGPTRARSSSAAAT